MPKLHLSHSRFKNVTVFSEGDLLLREGIGVGEKGVEEMGRKRKGRVGVWRRRDSEVAPPFSNSWIHAWDQWHDSGD